MPGKDSNIRKDLSKKTFWRSPRITRIAKNILGGHAKIDQAVTLTTGTELGGRTDIYVQPFYMIEYLKDEYGIEDAFTGGEAAYFTAFTFFWGKPGTMATRCSMVVKYPHKYDEVTEEEGPGEVANSTIDQLWYFDRDNTEWGVKRIGHPVGEIRKDRSHIMANDKGRLSLPPRLVFRDAKRAILQIEKIARKKGYY